MGKVILFLPNSIHRWNKLLDIAFAACYFFHPDPAPGLVDQVRQVLGYHNDAYRTEKRYGDWIVRFIRFHGCKKQPKVST